MPLLHSTYPLSLRRLSINNSRKSISKQYQIYIKIHAVDRRASIKIRDDFSSFHSFHASAASSLRNDILSFRHCLSWITKKKERSNKRFHFNNFSSFKRAVKRWMERRQKNQMDFIFYFKIEGFWWRRFFYRGLSILILSWKKPKVIIFMPSYNRLMSVSEKGNFPMTMPWINLSSSHEVFIHSPRQETRMLKSRRTNAGMSSKLF